MSNRNRFLTSLLCALVLPLSACIFEKPAPPVWRKFGWTQKALNRDLAVAHAEAETSYPSAKPFEAKAKDPAEAHAMLEEARHSVVHLWMTAHGWDYVRIEKSGRRVRVKHGH